MSLSSHVRESKTVLDSGFQTLDSGFQVLDSSLFVWWTWIWIQISNGILDSLSRIPDSTEKRIAGFWIPRARISPISESKFRLKERNFQSFWRSSLVFVSLTNLRSWLPWWRWPTSHDLLNLYFQFFLLMGLTAVKRSHFLGEKAPRILNLATWIINQRNVWSIILSVICHAGHWHDVINAALYGPLSLSHLVRESKTVLDSGFQSMDSGFSVSELGFRISIFVGFWIPWAVFRIPQEKNFGDSGNGATFSLILWQNANNVAA